MPKNSYDDRNMNKNDHKFLDKAVKFGKKLGKIALVAAAYFGGKAAHDKFKDSNKSRKG